VAGWWWWRWRRSACGAGGGGVNEVAALHWWRWRRRRERGVGVGGDGDHYGGDGGGEGGGGEVGWLKGSKLNTRHERGGNWRSSRSQQKQAAAPTPWAHPRKLRKSTDEDAITESLGHPRKIRPVRLISDSRNLLM
jgi:hypothetical protein